MLRERLTRKIFDLDLIDLNDVLGKSVFLGLSHFESTQEANSFVHF